MERADKSLEGLDNLIKPGGVGGAIVNLAVASLGAGVLAIPAGFAEAGILVACGITVVVGFFTVTSIGFLAECIEKMDLNSYESLSRNLLGRIPEQIVRGIIIFYCFGTAVGYIVLVGELAHPFEGDVAQLFPAIPRRYMTDSLRVIVWATVMVPGAIVRNINTLRMSSLLAVLAAVYLSLLIVFRYFFPLGDTGMVGVVGRSHSVPPDLLHVRPFPHECRNFTPRLYNLNVMLFLALPIMFFSFDCQVLVYQLYNSLHRPSIKKMVRVGSYSCCIAAFTYFCIGIFGYLSTGPCVRGNILLNYNPKTDVYSAIAYVFYFVPIVMAYAMALIPTRDAVFNVVYAITPGDEVHIPSSTFYGVSLALSLLSLVCALFVPGILAVASFLGGLCSSTVCFTLPALFMLQMNAQGIIRLSRSRRFLVFSMLALGVVGGALGTGVATYKWYIGYD